jgi:hypothetical protein
VVYKPKLLVIDIEWRPTKAYVWEAWGVNITSDKVIEHGGLLCVGAKWVDGDAYMFSEWEHGHQGMVEAIHALMLEAEGVITYNGDRFDLKKLSGEFLLAGLTPVVVTSLDLLKTVKRQGYFQNGLKFIGPFLGLGEKDETGGFDLWKKVEAGDAKAQKKMAKYCGQDVRLTERLYKKIKPFITNHPYFGPVGTGGCPTCGSTNLQKRGPRYTRFFQIQRLQCTDCGSWTSGERTKI